MNKKILITGGTGMVGSALSERLRERGYEVVHLSRYKSKSSKFKTYLWDVPGRKVEAEALDNVHSIVHLAGAGIADKRWTDSRKKELTDSRIESTNLLFRELKKNNQKIASFIAASAIGIYGFDTGGIEQEESRQQLGDDFLATLTKKWEASADQLSELTPRLVKLRIGLVLSTQGGLLAKLLPPAKLGLSSAFGSGHQYMSWIHIKDLVAMIIASLENENIKGVYNAVAPNPVSNKEFLTILGKQLGKPYFLPNTPKVLIRLAFGELASAITGGNKVSCKKIQSEGFEFAFADLSSALKSLLE